MIEGGWFRRLLRKSRPNALGLRRRILLTITFGSIALSVFLAITTYGLTQNNLVRQAETIVRREDPEELARGVRATEEIVSYALELGGTIAGEHGVGYLKRQFMRQEHGAAVELMRGIKALFDPNGIMNPGKILPTEE